MFLFNILILCVVSVIVLAGSVIYEPVLANELVTKELTTENGVSIPENEYISFFDSNGIYTVVGNIKNSEKFSVVPTILINIQDGKESISKSFEQTAIAPSKEIPFKIKFPEIKDINPVLGKPEISYIPIEYNPVNVQVIYDETLILHEDGHLTGQIINNGNNTVHDIKVFAIIHGFNEVLDMAQNMNIIEKLGPGEIRDFEMYPDPSINSEISYYSCFAVTDSFVRPMYTERNGEKFYFRYDSGTWYVDPHFNEKGTELSMRTQNSFPIGTYTNFEFPMFAADEKFSVFVNNEPKNIIQSIGERQNWHISFLVNPLESGEILIKGFKEGYDPGDDVLIPDWIKFIAAWWAEGKVNDDEFVRGIEFMIKEKIIIVKPTAIDGIENTQTTIPEWFRNNALWWSQDDIENETFANGLEFLINQGIIRIL